MFRDVIVREVPALADTFAGMFEAAVRRAHAEGRSASIAVPGGSVAEAFLPRLVTLSLDWRRVLVFFVDERVAPPDAPESNARLVREAWLDRVPIPLGNICRMRGELSDPSAAAADYERVLLTTVGEPPRLDIVLLGVGEDGHVASLFPGHRALEDQERYVLAVRGAPKPPPDRLTLTLLAIAAARSVVLAAFGAAKAAIVREAIEVETSTLPAARALRAGPGARALLDPEAASLLSR